MEGTCLVCYNRIKFVVSTAKTLECDTSSTFLGRFSCISVTKDCNQFTGKLFSFSEDLFGYIPGISTTTMQPRGQIINNQTSPEMLIYRVSERRY